MQPLVETGKESEGVGEHVCVCLHVGGLGGGSTTAEVRERRQKKEEKDALKRRCEFKRERANEGGKRCSQDRKAHLCCLPACLPPTNCLFM